MVLSIISNGSELWGVGRSGTKVIKERDMLVGYSSINLQILIQERNDIPIFEIVNVAVLFVCIWN